MWYLGKESDTKSTWHIEINPKYSKLINEANEAEDKCVKKVLDIISNYMPTDCWIYIDLKGPDVHGDYSIVVKEGEDEAAIPIMSFDVIKGCKREWYTKEDPQSIPTASERKFFDLVSEIKNKIDRETALTRFIFMKLQEEIKNFHDPKFTDVLD